MGNRDRSPSDLVSEQGKELDDALEQLATKTRELEVFISSAQGLSEILAKTITDRNRATFLLAERTSELAESRQETAAANEMAADATESAATEHEARVIANEDRAVAHAATATANVDTANANEATATANHATAVEHTARVIASTQLQQAVVALATTQVSLKNKSAEFDQAKADLSALTLDLKNLNRELLTKAAEPATLGMDEITRLHMQQLISRNDEITEANMKMNALMGRREEFIAALTHDLKNPLISCSQIVQAILDEKVKIEDQPKCLKLVLDSTNSMLRMIWNLLVTYKDEHGSLVAAPDAVNLAEVLNACIAEFTFRCSDSGIKITLEGVSGLQTVQTDQVLLKRVLINVLDNAIKFTPENGTIKIAVAEEQSEIISVRDFGKGIATEELTHVFEQFWQHEKSERRNSTGLGLYISRQIMHVLGGRIECKSELGSGTEFSLFLPVTSYMQ
ncbi:MAG: HAMP domain-containing sensor histidine kinase [Candidatus Melainabacteria bacterium]|nr:HAMP domain-containing sensor histidine kinase [Candidatus Melainabacteria bacterium]